QIEGVEFLKDRTSALLADEMGTGKTLQALTAMSYCENVKALIICPASVKYNWEREIRDWGFKWSVQIIDNGKDKLKDADVTIINYEQVINRKRRFELYNRKWTHLICDECFHGDTLIETERGEIPIKDIFPGDRVKNCLGFSKVKEHRVKKLDHYFKIEYNGRVIRCSPNHPFLTNSGWKTARELRKGELLANVTFTQKIMSDLWQGVSARNEQEEILQYVLFSEMENVTSGSEGDKYRDEEENVGGVEKGSRKKSGTREAIEYTYATKQSDEKIKKSSESIKNSNTNELEAGNQRGQRGAYPSTTKQTLEITGEDMEAGVCGPNKRAQHAKSSYALQNRHSTSTKENSHRDRRSYTRFSEGKISGQEKNRIPEFFRVESITVQKSGSYDKSSGCASDYLFHDLEVEGHPSFAVNSVLVHNSHYCKNFSAQRTEAILGAHGIKNKAARRWMMTGTPVLNRPVELYPLLKSLVPGELGKYSRWLSFTQRYCEGHYGLWGYDATGAGNLEELSAMLSGFMLRRLKKDIMTELPAKTFEKILISSKTKCELDELKTAMRQEVGLAKIDAAVSHIKDILEQKDKVVVFGYHREVLETLKNKLTAFSPVLVYGGIDSKKKDDLVQKFVNDPKTRVFIGNILSAGVGVNGLQRVTDTAVFVELVYTPGAIHQACDRLHREGQSNAVLIQFMVIKDTIDEEMIDTIINKEKVIHKITRDDKETLRFTIQETKPKKKRGLMGKIANAIEELYHKVIEDVAERLVAKLNLPTEEPAPTGMVMVEEPEPEPEPEPVKKVVKKRAKKEETVVPETAGGTTPEMVDDIRARMRMYLNGLTDKDSTTKKKALGEALNTRISKEIGQLSAQGLNSAQCAKYADILIEEFTKQFGGEAWVSIAQ
ncbi:MAG: hypothetical protein EOL91_08880, partial [Actinobacteria bacterium]|nr:hypothetical protein [Actinomycetota bacterium]